MIRGEPRSHCCFNSRSGSFLPHLRRSAAETIRRPWALGASSRHSRASSSHVEPSTMPASPRGITLFNQLPSGHTAVVTAPRVRAERELMSDTAFRHRAWTRLEPSLRESTTIDNYLQAATDMTADVIEVVGSYSLSISLYGKPITVGSSDRAAWDADQVEFDTEDGPCVEALRTGAVSGPIDLATERRWPAWTAVATLLGFSSAAGVPGEVSPGQRSPSTCMPPHPRRSMTRPCIGPPCSPKRSRAPSRPLSGSSRPTNGPHSWNKHSPVDPRSTRPSAS